jgi:putative hydrolase of the HAD superfamily
VDGTLVDPEYNDLIWFKEIPNLIANKRKISFEDAKKYALKEFENLGSKNLKWYDINYWISYFDLQISHQEILKKYESQIKIYPSVIPLLENLKERYDLIIISAMPREFLYPKIVKLEKYFTRTFSAITDFKQLKNTTLFSKIARLLKIQPLEILHVGDSWNSDYLSAKNAGMNTVFLDRNHEKEGENVIYHLEEIQKILKKWEEN